MMKVGPSPAVAGYALWMNSHAWFFDVHGRSQVHQRSLGCGCGSPREERHRPDPKGIARIQILIMCSTEPKASAPL